MRAPSVMPQSQSWPDMYKARTAENARKCRACCFVTCDLIIQIVRCRRVAAA